MLLTSEPSSCRSLLLPAQDNGLGEGERDGGAETHHEVPSQQITLITNHSPVVCITDQPCSTLALSRFYSKVQHVQARIQQTPTSNKGTPRNTQRDPFLKWGPEEKAGGLHQQRMVSGSCAVRWVEQCKETNLMSKPAFLLHCLEMRCLSTTSHAVIYPMQ